ncbi:MAG: 50S ribosomal protein L21e [Candidatus Aenigmatarchaeota archaeon]
MVRKSYGKMKGSRHKLSGKKASIADVMEEYKTGETIHVDFSSHKMPHPKFQGLMGKIVDRKGNTYIIEVRDKKALKRLYLKPEHLRR